MLKDTGKILASLIFWAILSGIILSFLYSPQNVNAYKSIIDIKYFIPFADIIHNFHKLAGDIAIIFLFLHLFLSLPKDYSFRYNLILILLFWVVIFWGFTGYILKMDQEGYSAYQIFAHIIGSFPLLGKYIIKMFGSFYAVNIYLMFIWHSLILTFIAIYLVYKHNQFVKSFLKNEYMVDVGYLLLILSFFIEANILPYYTYPSTQILGPWFFRGIQFFLFFLPKEVAIILPMLFSILVYIVLTKKAKGDSKANRYSLALLIFVGIYAVLVVYMSLLESF